MKVLERLLLSLAGATRVLCRIPGANKPLEPLRRIAARLSSATVVTQFDGDLSIEVAMDEHIGSQIIWFGHYERRIVVVMDRLLRPGMVVADVGANIGELSLFAAKRVGREGRVYAFEPHPDIAARLEANVKRNGMRQIEIHRVGLAAERRTATLYDSPERFNDGTRHAGLYTVYKQLQRANPVAEIPLERFDDYLLPLLSRLDLVKLDIEGGELAALEGARKAFRRFRPAAIVEIGDDLCAAAGHTPEAVLRYFDDLDYQGAVIGRLGLLWPINGPLPAYCNVLFRPRVARHE